MTRVWIVGRSGMLGSAIARRVALHDGWIDTAAPPLPWRSGPDAVRSAALEAASALCGEGGRGPWAIIWVGGAAVTSSGEAQADAEFALLSAALDGIAEATARDAAHGAFFLASSAGGVYAGSADPPFTESTTPVPVSPYGRLKLRSEELVRSVMGELGVPVLVGRIANLYGPGQRLDKMQGLVSHLALARLTASPASVFVPLDTLRDYLYVDDAAELVLAGLHRLRSADGHVTKIFASGKGTSIAELLGQMKAISKARPRVVLGTSPSARHQALDLRFRSTVWPDLDRRNPTSLPEGIDRTLRDIAARLREPDQRTAGSSAR